MDFEKLTKNELIQMLKGQQSLSEELLNEKEHLAVLDFAWPGNLGHWYWNIKSNEIRYNFMKMTALGYSLDEIPEYVTYQFFADKIHPEDYQRATDVMTKHLKGDTDVYEVEFRIRAKDGSYRWFYDRGKITQYDEDGSPLFLAGIVYDITEKKKVLQELEEKKKILVELSLTDELTGIYNHRTLIDQLMMLILDTDFMKHPFSIAMLDIDDFKKINDTHGHLFGDVVLHDISEILKNNIRDKDILGRYGGEEFMIIFRDTKEADAIKSANRIRRKIEANFFSQIQITISGGVKEYTGEKLEELIRSADMKLFQVKNNGKNQII